MCLVGEHFDMIFASSASLPSIDRLEIKIKTLEELIDKVSKKIITWNKEDIWDIKGWLDIYHYDLEFYEHLTGKTYAVEIGYLICFLPSEDIPLGMLDKAVGRVWATDKHEMCLVGEHFDIICHIDDLKIKK